MNRLYAGTDMGAPMRELTRLNGATMSDRPCDCGSGKPSRWFKDARDIELFRGCDDCSPAKLSRYRPEVLTDPNYEASEPIEPDDWQLDRRS